MSENLEHLVDYLNPILNRLSPAERSVMARTIGRDLRKSQSKRISEQKNPDSTAYTPRRTRLRDKKGFIKRKMFQRMKTQKYFKLLSNSERISLGFLNKTARIARVHQEGLKDRAEAGAPSVIYPKRELLGFTEAEIKMIEQSFLKHINI